jgi:hypothetical protein
VTARLEEIKQIKVSWSELYEGLSDSQKKEADEIVLPMMGLGVLAWAGDDEKHKICAAN